MTDFVMRFTKFIDFVKKRLIVFDYCHILNAELERKLGNSSNSSNRGKKNG